MTLHAPVVLYQASFDIDMELAGGKDRGGRLPGTPLNVPSIRSGFKTWEYSVSSGAMLDLSLRGAAQVVGTDLALSLMQIQCLILCAAWARSVRLATIR